MLSARRYSVINQQFLRIHAVLSTLAFVFLFTTGSADSPESKVFDKITVKQADKTKKQVADAIEVNKSQVVPDWLSVSGDAIQSEVVALPRREHVPHPIQEQLIIELCSK